MEVMLVLVSSLSHLEFPCHKNSVVLELLVFILIIEAFTNDVDQMVILISKDIGSTFSGITRAFMG